MLQIIDFFRMSKLHLSNNLYGRLTEKYGFYGKGFIFHNGLNGYYSH